MTSTPEPSLTPLETSFLTPDIGADYREMCEAVGLIPTADGYGMLHCEDGEGNRVTLMTTDVAYLKAIVSAPQSVRDGLTVSAEVNREKFPLQRSGWPRDWFGIPQ